MKKNLLKESKKKRPKKRQAVVETRTSKSLLNELDGAKHLNAENFSSEVKKIAKKTGHKFLFDVPRILMDEKKGFVAALLCLSEDQPTLYFVTISSSFKSTHLIEQSQAPKQLVNFAWSFANVLMLVGNLNKQENLQEFSNS